MYFLLTSIPGLVFKKPKIIGVIFIEIAQFFLFLTTAYFVIIPLGLLGWQKLRNFYFWALIFIAILIEVVAIVGIVGNQSAISITEPNLETVEQAHLVYWESSRGMLVGILQGAIIGLSVLFAAIFFVINGLRSSEGYIRARSLIIAVGLVTLTLAAGVNYVWGATSENIFLSSIIAALLTIFGLLAILIGIYHRKKIKEGLG